MKKTIMSLFVLVLAVCLFPLSSEAAQINFYDIDNLNTQEQAAIVKEKPSINETYAQYNLVYQKVLETTDTNNSSQTQNMVAQKPSKKRTQTTLPKAGESGQTSLLVYGMGVIVVSLFILYKRKKYRKLLLIILLPAALGTTSTTVLAANKPLLPAETIALSDNETKTIEPAKIDGYVYVGYYPESPVTPPTIQSMITVLYLDEAGKEIHEAKTITGTVGTEYDVSTDQFKLKIADYTLNETKLPGNAVGKFTKEAQTIIYEYQKIPVTTKGKVIVRYLDQTGNALQPEDVLSGEVDQAYHVDQKTIPNYLFKEHVGELDGTYTEAEQVVTLYYTDEVQINIHYVEKWTQKPLELSSLSLYAPYLKPEVSDIDDYYYTDNYSGKHFAQGASPADQLTVKAGTTYDLPKEIRFLITKPTGETMDTFNFPNPIRVNETTYAAISSYTNFPYFIEKPEYIPSNHTGIADQLVIDVTYEMAYIPAVIADP